MSLPEPQDIYSRTMLVNRGSALDFGFTWPVGGDGPADLIGWSIGVLDLTPGITVNAVLTNPVTRRVDVVIPWNNAIQAGSRYTFRLQITNPNEEPDSTQLIEVIYQ